VLGSEVERLQRLGGAASQRSDERAIVRVRHLAGTVVELELLQRPERTVSFLGEGEPLLFELVRRNEPIILRRRLVNEGQADEEDANNRKERTDDERRGQIRTAASA
jgi:hypothetical protein